MDPNHFLRCYCGTNGALQHPTLTNLLYLYGGTTSDSWKNLFSTTDGGTSWSSTLIGSPNPVVYDFCLFLVSNVERSYAATSSGEVFRKVGNEVGYTSMLNLGSNNPLKTIAINPETPATVYAGGPTGLWKSTNSGDGTWIPKGGSNFQRLIMHPSFVGPYASANYLFAVCNSLIYKSTDGGNSWVLYTGSPSPVNDIKVERGQQNVLYVATSSGVYKINVAPASPGSFGVWDYCPGGGGGVRIINRPSPYCYPNLHWNSNTEPEMNASPAHYDIYRKVGSGNFQLLISVPYTATSYTDFTVVQGQGYCYKMTAVDINGIPSDFTYAACWPLAKIAGQWKDRSPKEFSLNQCAPNPFNPTTVIHYNIPTDVHVTLKVYDMVGREVATLIDEVQAAGYKSIEFDASKLPSGVYMYRIQAGKFHDVKKMLLVK